MRKLCIAIYILFLYCYNAIGQATDILFPLNGHAVPVTIIEIGEVYIKYKNGIDLSMPTRSISISNVHKIIYKNGTEEVFNPLKTEDKTESNTDKPNNTGSNLPNDQSSNATQKNNTPANNSLPAYAPFKYSPFISNPKQEYMPKAFTTP